MTEYTISLSYKVSNNTVEFDTGSTSPSPPGSSKTGSDDDGNVTVDKGDTASIEYECSTSGYSLAEVQMKTKGRDKWGKQKGKNRLDSDAAEDFPDVPADSGTVTPDSTDKIKIKDDNKKSSKVDYRVGINDDGTIIWSDPRVKNNGD